MSTCNKPSAPQVMFQVSEVKANKVGASKITVSKAKISKALRAQG
jgi:hypothetical protein